MHNAYAFKKRAASIPGTYVRKARRVDQRFNGTAVNAVGPMEQRLKDFGDPCVTPLVFGCWGEINSEFDDLLKYAASVGASRLWQPMLAASPEKAQGILLWNLRRRVGCEALRAWYGMGKCAASHGPVCVHHGRCSSGSCKKGSCYVYLFSGRGSWIGGAGICYVTVEPRASWGRGVVQNNKN